MSDSPESDEAELIIHNGVIVNDVPGVKTEPLPTFASASPIKREVPQSVEDVDPEQLAGLMAAVISAAMDETPKPSPMEIVTRLLMLQTERGHKVVWTRFDINQLFALWTNKLDRNRLARNDR